MAYLRGGEIKSGPLPTIQLEQNLQIFLIFKKVVIDVDSESIINETIAIEKVIVKKPKEVFKLRKSK